MPTISEALAAAIQHYRAGRFQTAEQTCRRILAVEPNHAEAFHLLGMVARQAGRHEIAVEYIQRAIRLKGNVAVFHVNLGNVLYILRKLDEAVACYRRALELKPDFAKAHNNLGNALKDQGKFDDAIACYRRALELNPDYAEAHNNLGAARHGQGNLDEAAACYRRALDLQPDYAEAQNNLGSALLGQGNRDEAIACYRRALELQPDFAEAHINLGNALHDHGDLNEVVACYRRAVKLKPDYAEAHDNLGNALMNQGKPDEAIACYRRALQLQPDFADAHNNLGTALYRHGDLDEAIASYRRALELRPDQPELHNNLGAALKDRWKLDEAIACCRRALEVKPDYAEAHNNLGNVFNEQGRVDEAIACYRRALELRPDYAGAHRNLGIAFTYQGKLDEAVACCRQVVRIEFSGGGTSLVPAKGVIARPGNAEIGNHLGEAFLQLATILRSRLPADDLLAMRQLSSDPNLGDDDRAALQFGLAQALDARGDCHAAAEHAREANALRLAAFKRRKRDYRPAMHGSFVSEVLATCTPDFFVRTSGFGLESEQPVFIVGLPRSGTTLAEQFLASHSRVFAGGELRSCRETLQSLPVAMNRNDTPLQCLRDIDRETARNLAQQLLNRLRALDERALRIVDKMPENFLHLGLIRVLFPTARLIHCRRDLRDVALSCWMTKFTALSWTCDQEHIVSYFEEYSRLMDHWREVLPSPPLDVAYEDLVEDTEGTARGIIEWCGLEWEPGCLDFYATQRPVRTASATQVRRPIYKNSVGRWKNYENSLSELFSRVHRLDEMRLERQPTTDRGN
jgi:tetratricopeptide (TPR) repeat protein